MTTLTVRNLDDTTRHRPRLRAAVADDTPTTGLGTAIHALFADAGGVELDLPPRLPGREPPTFD